MEHAILDSALNSALPTALGSGVSAVSLASVSGQALGVGLGVGLGLGLGLGAYFYAAHWPASQLFGRALIAPPRPGEIALTFDDGPNPRWTPQLLEILARHNVRATFFLIGKYAAIQKPLVRQMHSAGHLIANHSWSHPNFARVGDRKTREELTRAQHELEAILGEPVRFFRPPFGGRRPYTLRFARQLGLTPVLWNAMAADWRATSADQASGIANRLATIVLRNQQRGGNAARASNIVLHDGGHRSLDVDRSASIAAAALLLDRFTPTHQFVTLQEWPQEP